MDGMWGKQPWEKTGWVVAELHRSYVLAPVCHCKPLSLSLKHTHTFCYIAHAVFCAMFSLCCLTHTHTPKIAQVVAVRRGRQLGGSKALAAVQAASGTLAERDIEMLRHSFTLMAAGGCTQEGKGGRVGAAERRVRPLCPVCPVSTSSLLQVAGQCSALLPQLCVGSS